MNCYYCNYEIKSDFGLVLDSIMVFCSNKCRTEYAGCDQEESLDDYNRDL